MKDFLLRAPVVVRTSSMKISRRRLADYVKILHQKGVVLGLGNNTIFKQCGILVIKTSLFQKYICISLIKFDQECIQNLTLRKGSQHSCVSK